MFRKRNQSKYSYEEEEDFKKIRACLDLGVDINCRGSDNHSALYNSLDLFNRNKKIFDFLIEHPYLDVDQINSDGILERACFSAQEDQVRNLCNLPGIDVNAGNPLSTAILHHNVAAINILAENPALDWNAGDYKIQTPIVQALRYGYADIVEILLSKPRLDLTGTDDTGRTVAHFAVEYEGLKRSIYFLETLNVSAFPVKCV